MTDYHFRALGVGLGMEMGLGMISVVGSHYGVSQTYFSECGCHLCQNVSQGTCHFFRPLKVEIPHDGYLKFPIYRTVSRKDCGVSEQGREPFLYV